MNHHGVRLEERDGTLFMVSERTCCARCVLPDTFPDVDLRDGVCAVCRSWDEREALDDGQAQFERVVGEAAGSGTHDVLVLYSGGKDSTVALARLAADRSLRTLAVTMDNGFLPRKTVENISRVAAGLGVEHVYARPHAARLRSLYQEATLRPLGADTLRYSTSACGVCISTVLAHGVAEARSRGIPMLVGGWTPGQFTWNSFLDGPFVDAVIAANLDVMEARGMKLDGVTPDGGPAPAPPLFNPLAYRPPSSDELQSCLSGLGWARPDDLDSCSSNCRLNALLVADHIERHGFHPYVYEVAHHVRLGLLDRDEALEQLADTQISAALLDRLRRQLFRPA